MKKYLFSVAINVMAGASMAIAAERKYSAGSCILTG